MKDQLRNYVELLFAGSRGTEDIRQEILQNTLDRYDDLVAGGKTPEAAYSLAIAGIGDVSELLNGNDGAAERACRQENPHQTEPPDEKSTGKSKLLKAVAVAMYILCPVPVLLLGNVVGVCLLLGMVAAATMMIVAGDHSHKKTDSAAENAAPATPRQRLCGSIMAAINALGLVLYFVVSFATGAWYITWLIFVITAAVNGLVSACMDLKEAD